MFLSLLYPCRSLSKTCDCLEQLQRSYLIYLFLNTFCTRGCVYDVLYDMNLRYFRQTRIFRRTGRMPRNGSGRLWPSVWPCLTRDAASELETREKEGRKKRRDVFPCDSPYDDEDEFLLRQQRSNFANRKELGHVRTPVSCPESKLKLSVDRAVGDRPNLVDGDYVIVELPSKRVYAIAVLRGTKGMHLLEMNAPRERMNTWKFCFYQAIVALLAKTQLRYRYVSK